MTEPMPTLDDKQPKDVPGYRMAFVLYHWPRPLIERTLLRSLLPVGQTTAIPSRHDRPRQFTAGGHKKTGSRNLVSDNFRRKLNRWEKQELLRREGEWLRIVSREAFAENASLLLVDKALWLAEIVSTYRHFQPIESETRRRELLTLQALMEGRGSYHASGRGSVRLLPRGGTL